MTTYTVFNMEDDDGFEDESGLYIEQTVERLIERPGCTYRFERIDGVLHICVEPWRWFGKPDGLSSLLPDDEAAKREILERLATGKADLPSTWCIEPDDKHAAETRKNDVLGDVAWTVQ
ncbi:hypothetical protein [Nitratireductor sp. OM-1]|uniref:hypothetical protein n=1 Tax=Nitratireductor sp. OM-1 TaxID=1756988 RepID=UPI000DDCFD19|nr:hypothetical protein [Nitratireductor sp. OM-1]